MHIKHAYTDVYILYMHMHIVHMHMDVYVCLYLFKNRNKSAQSNLLSRKKHAKLAYKNSTYGCVYMCVCVPAYTMHISFYVCMCVSVFVSLSVSGGQQLKRNKTSNAFNFLMRKY